MPNRGFNNFPSPPLGSLASQLTDATFKTQAQGAGPTEWVLQNFITSPGTGAGTFQVWISSTWPGNVKLTTFNLYRNGIWIATATDGDHGDQSSGFTAAPSMSAPAFKRARGYATWTITWKLNGNGTIYSGQRIMSLAGITT